VFPFGIETVNGSNFWRSPENPGAEGANTQRVESLRQKDGRCPKNQAIVFGSAVQHAGGGGLWFFPMAFFLFEPNMRDRLAARQAGFFVLQIDCRQKERKKEKMLCGK